MRRIISLLILSSMLTFLFAVGPVSAATEENVETVVVRISGGEIDPAAGNWYKVQAGDIYEPKVTSGDSSFVEKDGEQVLSLNQIPNGESAWYENSMYMFRGTKPENAGTSSFLEEFETYFELYHAQTQYPVTMRVHFRDETETGINAVTLDNGVIKVNGNSTGYYYQANEKYAFSVIADPVNDTVSTYLVSGPVSREENGTFAEPGEKTLLAEAKNLDSNNIGYIRRVSFMTTGLPTTQDVGAIAYFEDIKLTRLPFKASLKEEVKEGDTTIALKTNRWLASNGDETNESTTLTGNILIKRNGIPLTYGTDYTVDATTGGRSTVKTYARNPVITLTTPAAEGDTFEIDLSEVPVCDNKCFDIKINCTALETTIDPTQPPQVTITSVTGIERIGNTLTMAYEFDDAKGLGDNSNIQWESSADGITFSSITGATEESYVIAEEFVNQYIRVAIQPVNSDGDSGETVYSTVLGPIMPESLPGVVYVRLYNGEINPAAGNWYKTYSFTNYDTKVKTSGDTNFVEKDGETVLKLDQISNGTSTWYEDSIYMFRGNKLDTISTTSTWVEEVETYVELYHAQTQYPVTVHVHFRDETDYAEGFDAVTLDNGVIEVNGESTGYYYKANEKYAFRVVTDPVNDTISTYLVSGPMSTTSDGNYADLGGEILLKKTENLDSGNIGFVRRVSLMATNLPTDQNVGAIAYFKEIKLTRLPCKISLKEGYVEAGAEIKLETNHWLDSNIKTADNVIITKNGTALTPGTDYTVDATVSGQSDLTSYVRNPVITLTTPAIEEDAFEIDFSKVKTSRGIELTDQKLEFEIPGAQSEDKMAAAIATLGNAILNGNADFDTITGDLALINELNGVAITWESSDTEVIALDGAVTRPGPDISDDAPVTLTAMLSYEGKTYKKKFACTVKTTYDGTDLEAAAAKLTDELILNGNSDFENITQNMNLPAKIDDFDVVWTTTNPKAISIDGTVTRPTGNKDYNVKLTATLTDGIGKRVKNYTCVVKTTYDPNRPPQVTITSVTGIERIGNTLTMTYVFDDVKGLGDNSRIQWESSADGVTFTGITGATAKSYTIADEYVNQYIRVALQPINSVGTIGETVYSTVFGPIMPKISPEGSSGSSGSSGNSGITSRPSGNSGGVVSFSPSGSAGNANSNNVADERPEVYSFSDVPKSHWAADSVNELLSKGVISRDSSRNFRPEDNITREEFVKMIVTALKLEGGDGSFTDMDASHWAHPYAVAALKAGIVTGYEDGSFHGGQMITRQEMAVMLKRAMDYKGWNEGLNEAKEFIDGQEISDYAVSSIAAMSAAGIINGMPDGRFMPAANATRAQAAKIICGVYANE